MLQERGGENVVDADGRIGMEINSSVTLVGTRDGGGRKRQDKRGRNSGGS